MTVSSGFATSLRNGESLTAARDLHFSLTASFSTCHCSPTIFDISGLESPGFLATMLAWWCWRYRMKAAKSRQYHEDPITSMTKTTAKLTVPWSWDLGLWLAEANVHVCLLFRRGWRPRDSRVNQRRSHRRGRARTAICSRMRADRSWIW